MDTNTPERHNQNVCFIAGAGHSGSTLLGLILGSHPRCFYAGEAAKTRFFGNQAVAERKRVCKICGPDCPIWSDMVIDDQIDLYEQISAKTTKPMVIDSTKHVAWLHEQINTLRATSAQPCLIFLQRDGRAVLNSRIRKYPNTPVEQLICDWKKQIEQTTKLFEQFDRKKTHLHYEALASDPAHTMQHLCTFLEIDYQPDMLKFYEHEHHPLGGNTGTQSLVARAHQGDSDTTYVSLSHQQKDYYGQHPLDIRLDLRLCPFLNKPIVDMPFPWVKSASSL